MKRLRWPLFALIGCLVIFEMDSKSVSVLGYYLISDIDSETQGEVVESKLVPTHWRAPPAYRVVYTYVVDNVEYEFDLVNFHPKTKDAKDVISKYFVGKPVDVYYDSRRPQHAVLENTGLGFGIYWRVVFVAVLFIVFWFLDM